MYGVIGMVVIRPKRVYGPGQVNGIHKCLYRILGNDKFYPNRNYAKSMEIDMECDNR